MDMDRDGSLSDGEGARKTEARARDQEENAPRQPTRVPPVPGGGDGSDGEMNEVGYGDDRAAAGFLVAGLLPEEDDGDDDEDGDGHDEDDQHDAAGFGMAGLTLQQIFAL